jgi:hypothetical protein
VETAEKVYLTHDNGGRAFQVRISSDGSTVSAYERPPELLRADDFEKYYNAEYSTLTGTWQAEHVFVGISRPCEMTRFSGGIGKKFDGNSVLVHLKDAQNPLKYLFIGEKISTFTAPEPILYYYSPVGNNDVPYPLARTQSFVLFLCGEHTYFPIKSFKSVSASDAAYTEAWGGDIYTERYHNGKSTKTGTAIRGEPMGRAQGEKPLRNYRLVRKRILG